MSSWETRVMQSVFALDETYRLPLLEMIEVYVKSVNVRALSSKKPQPRIPVAQKKEAVRRMKELRAEVVLPDDFDPDKELAAAREEKYGGGFN